METSAEACWRLSKACGQWAVESRDSAARIAFRQMATEWARLAFNEEFTSPVDERVDPPTSENSDATPLEILASSLLIPSSENAEPEVERATGRDHTRDWPCREASLQSCGASRVHAKHTLGQIYFKKAYRRFPPSSSVTPMSRRLAFSGRQTGADIRKEPRLKVAKLSQWSSRSPCGMNSPAPGARGFFHLKLV